MLPEDTWSASGPPASGRGTRWGPPRPVTAGRTARPDAAALAANGGASAAPSTPGRALDSAGPARSEERDTRTPPGRAKRAATPRPSARLPTAEACLDARPTGPPADAAAWSPRLMRLPADATVWSPYLVRKARGRFVVDQLSARPLRPESERARRTVPGPAGANRPSRRPPTASAGDHVSSALWAGCGRETAVDRRRPARPGTAGTQPDGTWPSAGELAEPLPPKGRGCDVVTASWERRATTGRCTILGRFPCARATMGKAPAHSFDQATMRLRRTPATETDARPTGIPEESSDRAKDELVGVPAEVVTGRPLSAAVTGPTPGGFEPRPGAPTDCEARPLGWLPNTPSERRTKASRGLAPSRGAGSPVGVRVPIRIPGPGRTAPLSAGLRRTAVVIHGAATIRGRPASRAGSRNPLPCFPKRGTTGERIESSGAEAMTLPKFVSDPTLSPRARPDPGPPPNPPPAANPRPDPGPPPEPPPAANARPDPGPPPKPPPATNPRPDPGPPPEPPPAATAGLGPRPPST